MKVIGKITSIQDGEFLLRGINGKTRPLKEGEQVMEGEVVYSSENNEPIANMSLLLTDGTTLFLNDGDGLVLVETEIEKFKARFTEKDTASGEEETEDEGDVKAKFDIRSGDITDVISAGVKAVYTTDAKVSEEFTEEVKRDSISEVSIRGDFENSNSIGNNSQTERVPENVFENEEEKDITPDTKPIIIPETPKVPEKSKEPEVPEIPEVLPSGKATLHSNQVEEGQNILIYARVNNSSNKDLFLSISDGTKIVGVIKIPIGSKEGYLTLTNPIENTVYSSGTKTLNYYIESTNGGNYEKLELEGVSINVVEKTDLTNITLSAANVLEKENIEINVSLENPTKSDMYLTIADGENKVVGLIEIKAGESAGKLIISNPYLDNVSFKISNIQGGGFEKTDSNHINIKVAGYGTTTLKVDLTAESVKEGEDLTIKAELDYKAVTDITLTIKDETGDTVGHIIIKAGENTGTLIIETDKNPYIGGTEKEFIISEVNGGAEFKDVDISDKANVKLTDGEEVSKIILSSETLIVNEGESITIKAVVPKTQEDMSIEILKDGESIGYINILKGETEGTLTYQTEKTPYINSGNQEIEIGTVTGGGFEKVDDSDSLNIKVNEGNEETIFKTEISKTDVIEGENFRVSISLDNPVKEPLTVAVKDEAGNTKGYINLTEGESTGYIELSIPSSEYKEGLRSVKYTTEIVEGGSEFENLKLENEASVNVNDGNLNTDITISTDTNLIEEGESFVVYVNLDSPVKNDLRLEVIGANGFVGYIDLKEGESTGSLRVSINNPSAYKEGEQGFNFNVSIVSGADEFERYTLKDNEFTIKTTDGNIETELTLSSVSNAKEGDSVLITANITNAPKTDLTLEIVKDGLVIDYITIKANETTGSKTIKIENTPYKEGVNSNEYEIGNIVGGSEFESLNKDGILYIDVEDGNLKTELKVSVDSNEITEGDSFTVSVNLDHPVLEYMVLEVKDSKGNVVGEITLYEGDLSGYVDIEIKETKEKEGDRTETYTVSIKEGGSEFENLVLVDENFSIDIKDTWAKTIITLEGVSDEIIEGEKPRLKATLNESLKEDISVQVLDNNGATVGVIIIKAGDLSGSITTYKATDSSPYIDGEKNLSFSIGNVIYSKDLDIEKVNDASIKVVDGEISTTVMISSSEFKINEGETFNINISIENAPKDEKLVFTVRNENGLSIGTIEIPVSSKTGSLTVFGEEVDATIQKNFSVELTSGGNQYEKLENENANLKITIVDTTVVSNSDSITLSSNISSVIEGNEVRIYTDLTKPALTNLSFDIFSNGVKIGSSTIEEGNTRGTFVWSIPEDGRVNGERDVEITIGNIIGGEIYDAGLTSSDLGIKILDGNLETIINLRADNVEEGESVEVIASINKAPKEDLIISVRDSKGELKNILIEAGKFSGKVLFDSFADDAYIQGERTISYEIESVNLNFENLTKNGTFVKIDDNETAVNFTISKEERISDLIINHTAAAETTENTGKLGLFLYQSKSNLEYQYNYYKKGAYSGANFQIPLGLKDDDFNIVVEKEIKQDENGYYYEVKIVKDTPIKITTEFTFTENSSYSKLGAIKETMNEGETEVVFKNYLTDDFLNDRMIKNKYGSYTDENGHTIYKEGLENVMGKHHEFYSSIYVSNSLINNYTMVSSLQFNIAGDLEINTTKIELETIDKGEQIEISLTSSDKYLSNNGFFMVILKNEKGEIIKEYPMYLKQYGNGQVGEIGFYEKYEVKTYPSYLIDKSDFLGKGVVSYEIQLLTDYLDTARYNSDIQNRVYEDITYSSGTLNFGKEYLYKIQSEINPNISNPTVTVEITYKDGRTENRTVNLTSSGYAELKLNEEANIKVINSNAGFENESSNTESKIGNLVISSVNELTEGEDIEITLSIDKISSSDIYVYLQDSNNNEVGVVIIKAGDLSGAGLIKNEFKDNIFLDGDRNMKVSIKDIVKGDFTKINYDSKDILIKDDADEIKGNLVLDIYENRINAGSLNTSYINNGTRFQGINGWVDINKSGESTLVVFDYKNELKVENNIISGKNLMFELPYQVDSTKIGIEFEKIIDGMKVSFFNSYQTKGITGYAILNIETEGIKINYYDRDNKLYKTESSNFSNTIYFDSENKEYNNYLKNFGDSDNSIKNKTRLGYISIESDEKIEVKGLFIKNEEEASSNSYVLKYEVEIAPKTDLTLKIEDDKGVFVGDIIIKAGEKSGTLVLDKQEVGERTFRIKESIGGGFENLNIENEVSVDVKLSSNINYNGELNKTMKITEYLPFEETVKTGLVGEVYVHNISYINENPLIKNIFIKDGIMKKDELGNLYIEIITELDKPAEKDYTFRLHLSASSLSKNINFIINKGETKGIIQMETESMVVDNIYKYWGGQDPSMRFTLLKEDNILINKDLVRTNLKIENDSYIDTGLGKVEAEIINNKLIVKTTVSFPDEEIKLTQGISRGTIRFTYDNGKNLSTTVDLELIDGILVGTREYDLTSYLYKDLLKNGILKIDFTQVRSTYGDYFEDFSGSSILIKDEKIMTYEIEIEEDFSDKFDFINTFPEIIFTPTGKSPMVVKLDENGKATVKVDFTGTNYIYQPTIQNGNFIITGKTYNIKENDKTYEKEIIEPVKIKLSAEKEVIEGESIEITATINKAPENDFHITLSNGAIITILAGELSGSTIITNPFIDDNIVSDTITGNDRKVNLTISNTSNEFDYLDKNSKVEIKILENDFPKIKEGTAHLESGYNGYYFDDYLKNLDFNDSGDKLLYKGLEINFAKLEDLNNDGTANNAVLDLTWGYERNDNLKDLSIKDVLNLSDEEGIIKIKLDGMLLNLKEESDSEPGDIISKYSGPDNYGGHEEYRIDSVSFNKDENWVGTKVNDKEYVYTTTYEDKQLQVIIQVPEI